MANATDQTGSPVVMPDPTVGQEDVLWFNVGQWGQRGYAVANFKTYTKSINSSIVQLVDLIGRSLFFIMHNADADLRIPPSINTLQRVHRLIVRARALMSNRALAPATARMEPAHASPSPMDFLMFPIPYFKVRNMYLKEWAGLILASIVEMVEHTENRVPLEISTSFAGLVGQYLQRIYVRMATELFSVPLVQAQDPAFTLSDAVLGSYDPTKWFTSTEFIDTTPIVTTVLRANDPALQVLADGIPAGQLAGLTSYPSGASVAQSQGASGSASATVSVTGSFAPPPGA